MKPDWLKVVSFKTELLSEYLIHKGYRENLPTLMPKIGQYRNRMIVDNDIYVDLQEVNQIKTLLSSNLIEEGNKAYRVITHQSKILLRTSRRLTNVDVGALSTEEIKDRLKLFFAELQKTLSMIGIPTAIDLTLESVLKENLKLSGYNDSDSAFAKLAFSRRKVATNSAHIDLFKIALRKKGGRNIEKLVEKYAEKYGWLHSTLFLGEPYTPRKIDEDIMQIQDPALEIKRIKLQRVKQLKEAQSVIHNINNIAMWRLARFMSKAVYYRTARLEWMNQACFNFRPLMLEASRRINLDFNDFIYLYPTEIYLALDGFQVDLKKIKERQFGYALISDDRDYCRLFTGRDLIDLRDSLSTKVGTDQKEVSGMIACPGKVLGRAVVIKDRSQLNKVQFGDIMITPLTTPDFILAMKKAGAIVTDLGGVTSHAAIVSRELGIPCVVGTKIATRVFRDGDLVEVDASRGIIKFAS